MAAPKGVGFRHGQGTIKFKKNKRLAKDIARAKKSGTSYGEYMASSFLLRQAAEFAMHKQEFKEKQEKGGNK